MNKLKHVALKGKGYFCNVKLYKHIENDSEFALKELKSEHYSNESYRYRMNREIQLLKELEGCENIIPLIDSGHDTKKEKIWYLMPFASQNLYDYIKINNRDISKEERYMLTEQVINAIKYAHNKAILHRDISPNNVLVFNSKGKINLKVSDFGLGKDTESLSYYTGSSSSGYGQILYVSPEQRAKLKNSSIASDIYSLGKLIYFIFTGKDPDTLKPFELSSLVAKATEEIPSDRFSKVEELEKHFLSLKELQLNEKIAIEQLTLREIVDSKDKLEWVEMHEILVKGNYLEHVYSDYIDPVNKLLLSDKNLESYYAEVGNTIIQFVTTYSARLSECYQTVGWPFREMSTFGTMLVNMIKTVSDDEVRLICFKQLWRLAFEFDQWDVQKEIKNVFKNSFIPKSIETQLSEYVVETGVKVDLNHFSGLSLPMIVKGSIIKANKIAEEEEKKRKEKQSLENQDLDW